MEPSHTIGNGKNEKAVKIRSLNELEEIFKDSKIK